MHPFIISYFIWGKNINQEGGGAKIWISNLIYTPDTIQPCRRRKIIGVFIKIDPASSVVKKKVKAKSAIEVDLFEAITRKVEGVSEKYAS